MNRVMTLRWNWKWSGAGLVIAIVLVAGRLMIAMQAGPAPDKPTSQSRVASSHALPPLDGGHLETTVVEVTYPPGGVNAAHRHPCPVVGYILEGALRMQVKGQPERTYNVGESFYETPTDVHVVSANASQDTRARFLAYFVCDHRTPLSVPVTDPPAGGR
jgi:quercetin dioxygenase-like cupin family protein